MATQILFQVLLILHLTGLTLMVGTTVTDYIVFRVFLKSLDKDKERSLNLLDLRKKLSILLGIGAALLILSGTGLFIITDGLFIHQIWFKIKLFLVLALILNGFLVGTRQELKLKNIISENESKRSKQTNKAIFNLKIFYMMQMSIFFVVIFLSVFKFN